MLVLTRKIGEALIVGRDIIVNVKKIRGNRVYLAIDAPTDVHIDRNEVQHRNDKASEAEPNNSNDSYQGG